MRCRILSLPFSKELHNFMQFFCWLASRAGKHSNLTIRMLIMTEEKGIDAKHFGPTQSCQRCQIVTFLYRFMNP